MVNPVADCEFCFHLEILRTKAKARRAFAMCPFCDGCDRVSGGTDAALLCAFLLLRQRASARCTVSSNKRGVQTMRLHIEKHGHDPRQVDLVAVIALIVLVIAAICYLCGSATEPVMTGLIVPSQTVHW
jgi:hypothetical protein